MGQPLRDILAEAAKSGEVVRIVYHGGSQPGAAREILPIVVAEGEVLARDLASGINKTFKIAKIELPTPTTSASDYDPTGPQTVVGAGSVKRLFESRVRGLEALGWHVQLLDDEITLHRLFRNGRPRKSPDLGLVYCDEAAVRVETHLEIRLTYDVDTGDIEEERLASTQTSPGRPFRVYGRSFGSARSFGKLPKAAALFLDEARKLAPAKADQHDLTSPGL